MLEIIGGAENVLEEAKSSLRSSKLQWALQLCDIVIYSLDDNDNYVEETLIADAKVCEISLLSLSKTKIMFEWYIFAEEYYKTLMIYLSAHFELLK